jgi:hypothetical protein
VNLSFFQFEIMSFEESEKLRDDNVLSEFGGLVGALRLPVAASMEEVRSALRSSRLSAGEVLRLLMAAERHHQRSSRLSTGEDLATMMGLMSVGRRRNNPFL